ncbi:MAG: hypothetical protein AB8H86_22515 [Polyangiales bacterium]
MNLDYLKSLVKSGLDSAKSRLDDVAPVANARKALRELTTQGATLSEPELTKAISQTAGVTEMSVTARRGALQIQASFEDYEPLSCEISVEAIRFAPRGAKEMIFRVAPEECASHRGARAVVGTLASLIAGSLWAMVLGPWDGNGDAIVDRDGPGLFRVDLRSVPSVREAIRKGASAMVIDTLMLGDVTAESETLRLRFRLPGMIG